MLTVRVAFIDEHEIELELPYGATVADLRYALFHSRHSPLRPRGPEFLVILRGDQPCLDSDTVGDGWPYHALDMRDDPQHLRWPGEWHEVYTEAATIEVHVWFEHPRADLRYVVGNGSTVADLKQWIISDPNSPFHGHDPNGLVVWPQHGHFVPDDKALADAETYRVALDQWPGH
jgi:hypothetical protein